MANDLSLHLKNGWIRTEIQSVLSVKSHNYHKQFLIHCSSKPPAQFSLLI